MGKILRKLRIRMRIRRFLGIPDFEDVPEHENRRIS